ncbi:MAG: tRNA pseudouridine(55) synthase TruB [Bifidobacteriaceae bacterium]|jgi:tRNA pseudouridine55 synthase|nr:tRNA pseudouridine(55) synthase TruB [Bifidobacteriaceae bacterium]
MPTKNQFKKIQLEKNVTPNINGILLVDKEPGWTSHDVVAKMRSAFGQKKIGHAGTLDPFASGLLVLAFGADTKKLSEITALEKTYQTTIRLGYSTDTDDLTGQKIIDAAQTDFSEANIGTITDQNIKKAVREFIGFQMQTPSTFSAKKVDGVRAYKLARAGKSVKLDPKPVFIYKFKIISIKRKSNNAESLSENYIDIEAVIECSQGTYIRSMARDLGKKLGVGGHLRALRRLTIGKFTVDNAKKISEIIKNIPNSQGTNSQGTNSQEANSNFVNYEAANYGVANYGAVNYGAVNYGAVNYGAVIGKFSVLHKGHQALISRLIKESLSRKLKPRVIIINKNSNINKDLLNNKDLPNNDLVNKDSANKNLQVAKLNKLGIQKIDFLDFAKIKDLSFQEFSDKYLVDKYNVKYLLLGEGAAFGKGRLGNISTLQKMNKTQKLFEVEELELLPGISSTKIKQLVKDKKFAEAQNMLGPKGIRIWE